MKYIYKVAIFALVVLMFFNACQKKVVSNSSTDNNATIGSQLAVNLYQSLSGQNGGNNINNAGKLPAGISTGSKNKQVNATNNFCNLVWIDSIFNINTVHGDTTITGISHQKYVTLCPVSPLHPTGYNLTDSISYLYTYPGGSKKTTQSQQYAVNSPDTLYTKATIDGQIASAINLNVLDATNNISEYHNTSCQYVLTSLQVNATTSGNENPQIISGTSTFTASQTDFVKSQSTNPATINYNGTISFIGNYTAIITFTITPGNVTQSFKVNVLTGASVQQ